MFCVEENRAVLPSRQVIHVTAQQHGSTRNTSEYDRSDLYSTLHKALLFTMLGVLFLVLPLVHCIFQLIERKIKEKERNYCTISINSSVTRHKTT